MSATELHIESQIEQLLEVLRGDLSQMQENMARLDSVRELVIKRDIIGLEKLLEEIKNDAQRFNNQDAVRNQVRRQIAAELGLPVEDVRLSVLKDMVSTEQSEKMITLRTELIEAVTNLRSEHATTVLLLADLARFNRSILDGMFGNGKATGVTYDARGGTKRHGDNSLMSIQF